MKMANKKIPMVNLFFINLIFIFSLKIIKFEKPVNINKAAVKLFILGKCLK